MKRHRKSNSSTGIVILIVGFAFAMCCIGVIFMELLDLNPITSTSVPTALAPESLPTFIAQTFSAAHALTSAAPSPTPQPSPIPTETPASTILVESTSTIFIFDLQTNVAQPTQYIFETHTPFVLATAPPASGGEVCSCAGGLDCKDFTTHNQAQACYEYCKSLGHGDVHGLDGNDQDGLACESLP